ncbi:MAG: hypothetical protein K2W82_13065 [Candidatus Obscuribacterales bacterium]|nr:hypothetical protein [Candidatus Obscuribacterales bacterium]
MNNTLLALKKRFLIPGVCLVGLCLWLAFCKSHYESYWNGTIHRVQTVDFNLLHHTLPATLSQLILAGDDEAVQKVLDSTYGIFGLIVTDAQGKEVLFGTKAIYKRETWQPKLSLEYLYEQKEPFDLLTDPPPLRVQYVHASPRVDGVISAVKPSGKIIGRIYYVRGVSPGFAEDLTGAIASNWFEMSGSKRGYILITLIVIGFSLALICLILWRKRVLEMRERELEHQEKELNVRRKALEQLNADIAAQRKRKEWLEQEAELAYRRALKIKEALVGLKEVFSVSENIQDAYAKGTDINIRPPLSNTSALIAEVENLLPELTQNAKVLRSQAEVLQSYCAHLETKQSELQALLTAKSSAPYLSPENRASLGNK